MITEVLQSLADDISNTIINHCKTQGYNIDNYSLENGALVFSKGEIIYDVDFTPLFESGKAEVIFTGYEDYATKHASVAEHRFTVGFRDLKKGMLLFEEYTDQLEAYINT